VSEIVVLHGICKVAEFFQIFRLLWPERFETIWQQCTEREFLEPLKGQCHEKSVSKSISGDALDLKYEPLTLLLGKPVVHSDLF
jgi:hypothetical protein